MTVMLNAIMHTWILITMHKYMVLSVSRSGRTDIHLFDRQNDARAHARWLIKHQERDGYALITIQIYTLDLNSHYIFTEEVEF